MPVPDSPLGGPSQQAVAIDAAPASPKTLAVVAGSWNIEPPGNGVYIYDDNVARPTSVPGWFFFNGPEVGLAAMGPR